METQLKLIPASEHPTALESQWLNAISPADFINNNKNFDVLMMKYRCAIREIQTKLEVLDDEFSAVNKRNPISSIKSRVKSPASIYEKLRRRDLPFTEDSIVKNLDDVAGIRVICPFISDIYTIANLLTSQDDITVLKIKDYIKAPKSNGYRSYHMIVEIPVFFTEGKFPMRAEIQIRTIGMDFWSVLEYQLQYKKHHKKEKALKKELFSCAIDVRNMDQRMLDLRQSIENV